MRKTILIANAVFALASQIGPSAAQSPYDYPYCALRGDRGGGQSCYFQTLAQCRASLVGIGGTCIHNPGYRGPGSYDRRGRY
jgi:hypothetical protein